jgi:predicted small metal-binding protein
MTYSIRCADGGADCPAQFTTEFEGELMQHVQMHAQVAHPTLDLTDETIAQIKALVTTA